MIEASPEMHDALAESHEMVAWVDLINDDDDPIRFTALEGTQCTASYGDEIRRSGQLTLLDADGVLTPSDVEGLLAPVSSRFALYRGVRFSDGTIEAPRYATLYPQGAVNSDSGGAVSIDLDAYDAAIRCQGQLDTSFSIPGGSAVDDVVPKIIARTWPRAEFRIGEIPWKLPRLLIREDTVAWDEARKIMRDFGMDLFIDRDDVFTAVPFAMRDNTPVWKYAEGTNALFHDVERRISVETKFNVVVVVGTHSEAPGVRALAMDDNPRSRTYVDGPYGRKVKTVRSERITTDAQAQAVADVFLDHELGPNDEYRFSAVPNPLLDPGDVIEVTRERLNIVENNVIITEIDMPFVATDAMQVTARSSRFISDDQIILEVL